MTREAANIGVEDRVSFTHQGEEITAQCLGSSPSGYVRFREEGTGRVITVSPHKRVEPVS